MSEQFGARKARITSLVVKHPDWTVAQIANEVGCGRSTVRVTLRRCGMRAAPAPAKEEISDAIGLHILNLHAEGQTMQQIASRVGLTRGQVIGFVHRVQDATDKHDLTPHLNGTLAPDWWRAGLEARR